MLWAHTDIYTSDFDVGAGVGAGVDKIWGGWDLKERVIELGWTRSFRVRSIRWETKVLTAHQMNTYADYVDERAGGKTESWVYRLQGMDRNERVSR